MAGIPVIISDNGIPVKQVTSGAPLMTVATNGFGLPVKLSDRGQPFVVSGVVTAPVITFSVDTYTITSPVAGATYQWQRDQADIAGQTGTSYTHVAATDDDTRIRVKQTIGASVQYSNEIIKLIGATYAAVKLTWTARQDGTASVYQIDEFTAFDILGNPIAVSSVTAVGGTNSGSPANVADGTFTTYWQGDSGANGLVLNFVAASSVGSIGLMPNQGNYSFMPATMVLTGDPAPAGGGFTDTLATFTHPGGSNGWAYDYGTLKTFSFASGITITGVTLVEPDGANYATATISGTYSGTITDLEALVSTSGGVVISTAWTNTTGISGGAFTLTGIPVPKAAENGTRLFWVRDKNHTNIGAAYSKAVGVYAPVTAIELGMNASEWSGYGRADVVRNRALQCSLRLYDSNANQYNEVNLGDPAVPMEANGVWPSGVIPAPWTHIAYLLWENVSGHEAGAKAITFPAGMTASWHPTSQNVSSATTNGAAGTAAITVTDSSATIATLLLSGTPTGGLTPAGVPVTCYGASDSNSTRAVRDQFNTDYGQASSGLKWFRFMKVSGAEDGYEFSTPYRLYSPELVAATMIQLDVNGWITIPVNWGILQVDQFASRLNAALGASTLKVVIEYGNELTWNQQYVRQQFYIFWDAANNGLVSGVTGGSVINGVTYDANGVSTACSDPATGTTNRTFNTGDIVVAWGNGYQRVVAQAQQNTSIGAVIPANPAANNTDFHIIAEYSALYSGANKLQGRRQKAYGNIFKSYLGSRALSCLGVFLNDTLDSVKERLAFESCYDSIDLYAPTAYIGAAIAYDGSTYHKNHSLNQSSFVSSYKTETNTDADALIATLVAMKHGIESWFRVDLGIPTTTPVAQMATYEGGNHRLFRGANASFTAAISTTTMTVSAVSLGSIQLGMEIKNGATSYGYVSAFGTGSGGTGTYTLTLNSGTVVSTDMTGSIDAAMSAALAAVLQDSGYGTNLTNKLYTPLKNKIGGIHVQFVDYEPYGLINGSQIQLFAHLPDSVGTRSLCQPYNALSAFALANP